MAGPIRISVVVNALKARAEMRETANEARKMGKGFGAASAALKGAAFGAAAGGVVALGSATKDAVSSALSYEGAQRKAAAALRVNAGAAGQTLKTLKDRAAQTETLTGATQDENDVLAAQSRLLRAGIKGNGAFGDATLAAANLAAAGNQNITASSKVLTKALQDPTKAAATLRRQNVILSESQQKQIEAAVKQGDTAKAQGIVIGAVNTQLKDQAKAAGEGAGASFAILKDTLEDTGRDLAVKVLPGLTAAAKLLSKYLPKAIDAFTTGLDKVSPLLPSLETVGKLFKVIAKILDNPIFQGLAAFVLGVVVAFKVYTTTLALVSAATKGYAAVQAALNLVMAANPVGLLVLAIAGLIAVFVLAYTKSETFRNGVNRTFSALKSGVLNAINFVKKNWPVILAVLTGPIGLTVLAFFKYRDQIVGIFTRIRDTVVSIFSGIGQTIVGSLKSVINQAIALVNKPISAINAVAGKVPGVGSIPTIPALAKGGVVSSPTLALIGEAGPEAVIPLDKLNQGGDTNIYLTVQAGVGDPAAIGQQVVMVLQSYERSLGRRVVSNPA